MNYLLTLKPLKPFFFGGKQTLSNEEYYGISEYYPYPTQLLGAIRLFLAEQNQLITVHKNGKYSNKKDWKTTRSLLGSASASDFDTNDDIGVIKHLSSLFIIDKDLRDAFFPTPFDFSISSSDNGYEDSRVYDYSDACGYPFLDGYDPKNHNPQRLGGSSFWEKYLTGNAPQVSDAIKYTDVFVDSMQTGIALSNRTVIDKMFYVKTSYALRKDFLFACMVDIDEKLFGELKLPNKSIANGVIQIGAEGSLFALEVHSIDDIPAQVKGHVVIKQIITPDTIQQDKVVLVSPAISMRLTSNLSEFAILPSAYPQKMVEYHSSNNNYRYKGKTEETLLIPSGSVFYNPKENKLPPATGTYGKIGYNTYITTQGALHV